MCTKREQRQSLRLMIQRSCLEHVPARIYIFGGFILLLSPFVSLWNYFLVWDSVKLQILSQPLHVRIV